VQAGLSRVGNDGAVTLWNATNGAAIPSAIRHRGSITAAACSRDERQLVTASVDGTARVWSLPDGKPLSPPLAHKDAISTVCFGRRSDLSLLQVPTEPFVSGNCLRAGCG
jgi:WD40 repeat protein